MDWNACRRSVLVLPVLSLLVACAGQSQLQPSVTPKVSAVGSSAKVSGHACTAGAWFCDGFDSGSATDWIVNPSGAHGNVGHADGKLSILSEKGNNFLRYDAGKSKGVAAVVSDAAFAPVHNRHTADYYVEARIKPISSLKPGNKFICLLGRYQDVNNWYGACLNVQNGHNSKVEFHRAHSGKWFRTKQFGTRMIKDGTWYTLRLEMKGHQLTFYIDNDLVGSLKNEELSEPGKVGMWLDNRSFEVDDITVGDANVHPSLLSIKPHAAWRTQVGEQDLNVAVSASKPDGSTDVFEVRSSNPEVVSVAVSGKHVRLHANVAGKAVVTFVSGSKPSLQKTLEVEAEPAFVMPEATYGSLQGRLSPAAGEIAAYVDGKLSLAFDGMPQLTGHGSVRIFDAADDRLVDVVRPWGETDAIGPSADGLYRNVTLPLMHVEGHRLVVRPHSRRLQYHHQYYAVVANGTVQNAILNGYTFQGLGKRANWHFMTRNAPADGLKSVNVATSGTQATFRSVQGALDYAMQKTAKSAPITIHVAPGRYDELLYLRNRNNVTLQGDDRHKSVIAFDNYESLNSGSGKGLSNPDAKKNGGRAVLLVEDSDLLTLQNLTLQNSHIKLDGISNQAEAIFFNGDKERLVVRDADMLSRQDTLELNAYSWFYNTLIAGDVDFIWGSPKVALFENSEIRTLVDSRDASKGGYIVQARVQDRADKGFVFLNSRITREQGVPDGVTVLARSAGSPHYFDNVVYVRCTMDKHISAAGWRVHPLPNPVHATATEGWREFGSFSLDGKGALLLGQRDAASKQLSVDEVAPYATRDQVFSAIHWNPLH